MKALQKLKDVTLATIMVGAFAMPSTALAGPPDGPINVKQVEAAVTVAQSQIVAGKLDDGLNAIEAIRAKAVTTELADQVSFLAKLAEIRVAEKLGDNAQVLALLNEAFKEAKQPDQVQAVWQIGVSVANAAIAGKDNVSPVIDFLKGPASALGKFSNTMELARLRIAAGNFGAAEADLKNAATRAETLADWNAWIGVVNQLASAVDSGQAARAGADVYSRLHECATPVQAAMSIAQGRYLLSRNLQDGVESAVDQAVSEAISEAELLSAVSLCYDLAVNYHRTGKTEKAQQAVAKAEELALSCPASATQATIRGNALLAMGQPAKAADVFWAASKAVQTYQEQQQMLSSFGSAMVAAGDSANVAARLQAAEATPTVFVNVANAMAQANDVVGALRLLGTVPVTAFVNDANANIGPVMLQIQAKRFEVARNQAERVRAIAAALDAAAKDTKDPQAAAALSARAAAMLELATQVEK